MRETDNRRGLKRSALHMSGLILLSAMILAYALTGCGMAEPVSDPEDGKYLVYYLSSGGARLNPYLYETDTTDSQELVSELMWQFLNVPKDLDCQTALSDKVVYRDFELKDQALYLYFDINYMSMKADQEILCRAALARTLGQIKGVDYISIYCGDQPLMDSQGNPVGMISAGDFILNTSNVNSYEKTELTLYFADSTGTSLVEEKQEVVHNINTSLEQLIVEQLIAGPEREGHYATLPADCKILSISVTDNVCYINLDSAFMSTALPVNEYLPIYSIVNSLTEITSVAKVQIMVNGSQEVMFRDVVSLNTTFDRNPDYIESQ